MQVPPARDDVAQDATIVTTLSTQGTPPTESSQISSNLIVFEIPAQIEFHGDVKAPRRHQEKRSCVDTNNIGKATMITHPSNTKTHMTTVTSVGLGCEGSKNHEFVNQVQNSGGQMRVIEVNISGPLDAQMQASDDKKSDISPMMEHMLEIVETEGTPQALSSIDLSQQHDLGLTTISMSS